MFTFGFFLLVASACIDADVTPARYRIQLDSPPSARWNQVVDDHLQYLPQLLEEVAQLVPSSDQSEVYKLAENLRNFLPEEYANELEGIANRTGLPMGEIVILNVIYDLTSYNTSRILFQGCTGILACDENGRILHGRNLDYMMQNLLRNITILVDFYRGEKLVYSGTTFAFYTGLLTGQRPGGFTVSLNQRYSGSFTENLLAAVVTKFQNPVSFLIRRTLDEESSFARAVDRLSSTHIIAPCYMIVGGMTEYEGAIISRDRWSAADVQTLNETNWFLVQTNFDHWNEENDDGRKPTAVELLSELDRSDLNATSIFEILSAPPVRNDLTIFSGVMSAAAPAVLFDTTMIAIVEIPTTNEVTTAGSSILFSFACVFYVIWR
ncbi:hypothetical protein PMAYCL1PPCAC_32385 [Pristionchus mayeri]|uniref:N-acylethanolamine-hydrolyzing acid amidase n=1 Tax=Pristionchus mayeri TaxID=1317129 RepID=A0AAN5IFB2_9BILA|nr:hypothetical protein PMAYCL1PPCAC_32385 [Pristionchus mayeri]